SVGLRDFTVASGTVRPQPMGPRTPAQFALRRSLALSTVTNTNTVNQATFDYYDGNGTFENSDALTAATFSTAFNQCGPGSNRILAQRDACAVLCVNVAPATSGSIQATFQATDDANRSVTFST